MAEEITFNFVIFQNFLLSKIPVVIGFNLLFLWLLINLVLFICFHWGAGGRNNITYGEEAFLSREERAIKLT